MALSTNLGFPRIGRNREFKKTIESYWKGTLTGDPFTQELGKIHSAALEAQIRAGLDYVPVGDFSAYDLMLETAIMTGAIPKRFQHLSGWERYYAMARGTQQVTPCEMKKWFDTNYHYIVPEIEGDLTLTRNLLTDFYGWARQKYPGQKFRPVLIGPYTFLKLSRNANAKSFGENLAGLTKVYAQILAELAQTDCEWVQIDEPAFCLEGAKGDWPLVEKSYETLAANRKNVKLMVQTYYDDVAHVWKELGRLPADGIGLDLVSNETNAELLRTQPFPKEKWLGLGVVDGRNVWATEITKTLMDLEGLAEIRETGRLWIHPSCSLLHLPLTLENEGKIPSVLKKRLAFAEERLGEITVLTKGLNQGSAAINGEQRANAAAWADKEFAAFAWNNAVQERLEKLTAGNFRRPTSFEKRLEVQQRHLNLPPLPTTTIGSFPQTAEIRQARARWKKGELSGKEYTRYIQEEMGRVVRLQEELGLDVLVHGEPERTDMVEYFAERLKGFQITQNGWVQSYGTRCVRAPIIYGDVWREQPMTVEEARYAQSLTRKPMKGMLTGPVTMLNWSFPRVDVPEAKSAFQIALALRDEVADLESAGVQVIQIDEPALREGLPIKNGEWPAYLDWAVKAFRLSSSGVKETTQIHTHMCYSEFADILDAIQALDADVLSIEDSRSQGRLAQSLSEMKYRNGIGPGVYDVHSERVPSREEFAKIVGFLAENIPVAILWINPDCGLKTRSYKEVTPSLKNMVEAVKEIRRGLLH